MTRAQSLRCQKGFNFPPKKYKEARMTRTKLAKIVKKVESGFSISTLYSPYFNFSDFVQFWIEAFGLLKQQFQNRPPIFYFVYLFIPRCCYLFIECFQTELKKNSDPTNWNINF